MFFELVFNSTVVGLLRFAARAFVSLIASFRATFAGVLSGNLQICLKKLNLLDLIFCDHGIHPVIW